MWYANAMAFPKRSAGYAIFVLQTSPRRMQSNSEVRKGGEWIVRDRMARASPTPLGCFVNGDFKHAQQQQQELECDGEERADQSGTSPTDTPPPPEQTTKNALTLLRSLFTDAVLFDNVGGPIHAYILPRTDAHYSEYLCDRDLHVQFISGFTGSNAFVVVTQRDALLWTDGRYFVQIWTDRPPDVPKKLIHLSERECGETPASKLRRVSTMLRKAKCDSLVLSQLDEIAWLFNLRGSDIPFNPVFFAYAFVTVSEKAFLFVDLRKMSADVAAHLKQNNGVEMFEYADIFGFLKQYHQNRLKDVHPERHRIRDSAALVKFFHWLRNEVALGHLVDENRAARQCHYYREQLELFVSPSFETISAVDEHAAIPHYHMDEESGKKLIGPDSVYLLDSGGQYRDGTTDVTRTVCFAEKPDERFRRMFTLVFKSHVQCAMAKFPDGTYAMNLDGVSRAPLWAHGYDFEHGVGHGVGHFLNVHEFPPYIGYRVQYKHNSLRKGVVVTIEPGYYEQGAFGIRFENCYELVEAKGLEAARLGVIASASSSNSFITFAPLTFVPVQKSLLLRELLEQREIDWLNNYHNQCLEAVGRYLQEKGMQEEYNFLAEACTPL